MGVIFKTSSLLAVANMDVIADVRLMNYFYIDYVELCSRVRKPA